MAKKLDMWPASIVESVCEVLGDTAYGLTGTEIGRLLALGATRRGTRLADPAGTEFRL